MTDILAYQMKIATHAVSGNTTNQQLQFTLSYHIDIFSVHYFMFLCLHFLSPLPASLAHGESQCFSHLVFCELAKEIFTYCSKTSCLYNLLLDFATSLEKKNLEEPSWVDSRVLSPRFTNPLSNVTLRKTNKNGKFTKREKFSKSEVGPKKKIGQSLFEVSFVGGVKPP